eukprot:TRINITY_DN51030_c0_g1_i3.p1 TRINITY_DN51030_c0_g1~~TRINITY_DN51030_c0_g1_i3.p1  ORF type:complete len:790 (-),score=204.40 TRINITY_DN51030_c0_g1_i3:305-2674(-)
MAEELEDDPDLAALDLDSKELRLKDIKQLALATALSKNKALRVLALRSTSLSEASAKLIAEALEKNRGLEDLNLSRNAFGDAAAEQLVNAALREDGRLRSLDLSSTRITPRGGDIIAGLLTIGRTKVPMREPVWPLSAGDCGADGGSQSKLRALRLRDNPLGDAAVESLAAALDHSGGPGLLLEELDLCRSGVAAAGIRRLAQALGGDNAQVGSENSDPNSESAAPATKEPRQGQSSLLRLNLFGNASIGPDGARLMASALQKRSCRLRELNLSMCALGDEGVSSLASALERPPLPPRHVAPPHRAGDSSSEYDEDSEEEDVLAQLDAEEEATAVGAPLEDDLAKAHRMAKEHREAFEDEATRPRDAEAKQTVGPPVPSSVQTLEYNLSLGELELCKNDLTEASARSLADALEKNDTLLVLNLRDNQIGDTGAMAIAKALKKNRALRELDLGNNEVRDWGAREFGLALVMNFSLRLLVLKDNLINDSGLSGLATGIEKNMSIEELDMSKNQLGNSSAERLMACLEKNRSLSALPLQGNAIDDKLLQAIEDYVTSKRAVKLPGQDEYYAKQAAEKEAVERATRDAEEAKQRKEEEAAAEVARKKAEEEAIIADREARDKAAGGFTELSDGFERGVEEALRRHKSSKAAKAAGYVEPVPEESPRGVASPAEEIEAAPLTAAERMRRRAQQARQGSSELVPLPSSASPVASSPASSRSSSFGDYRGSPRTLPWDMVLGGGRPTLPRGSRSSRDLTAPLPSFGQPAATRSSSDLQGSRQERRTRVVRIGPLAD